MDAWKIWETIERKARKENNFVEVNEDAPEGSVFTGCDVGYAVFGAGNFRAERRFVGADGWYHRITHERDDVHTEWRKKPGCSWESPFRYKISVFKMYNR